MNTSLGPVSACSTGVDTCPLLFVPFLTYALDGEVIGVRFGEVSAIPTRQWHLA
jgi:hypothetical protein